MGSATNLYFVKKDLLITDILHVSLEQRPDVYMAVWNTDKAKICASISLGIRTYGLHRTSCI